MILYSLDAHLHLLILCINNHQILEILRQLYIPVY